MYRHLVETMEKIEIKLPLPWLLSVIKNLKKVSHNIRQQENHLDNNCDWNEAMNLSLNRKYIDSLEQKLTEVINAEVNSKDSTAG